jgi:iron complex transport system substrate-binding protein
MHSDASAKRVPRFSAPAAFGNLKKFCFFYVAVVLASTSGVEASYYSNSDGSRDCVCEFDAEVDYFPTKVSPQFATTFSISYHKNYKVIESTFGSETHRYVATLCGTPAPDASNFDESEVNTTTFLELPLRQVGSVSATFNAPMKYIGQLNNVVIVNTDTFFDGCFQDRFDNGIMDQYAQTSSYKPVLDPVTTENNTVFDAHFIDPTNSNNMFDAEKENLTMIVAAESLEPTFLAKMEYVEFFAAFFNRELAAKNIVDNIVNRLDCVTGLIADDITNLVIPRKKVLAFDYGFYGDDFNTARHTADKWKNFILQAGGELLPITETRLNATELLVQGADADVVFVFNVNWNQTGPRSFYAIPTFPVLEAEAGWAAFPAKDNVFLISTVAQFENAEAEPDLFLLDFIEAIHPGVNPNNHQLTFMYDDEFADNLALEVKTCVDPDAPLFNDWRSGSCREVGELVTIPGLTPPTLNCDDPTENDSSAETNGVNLSLCAAALLASVMALK